MCLAWRGRVRGYEMARRSKVYDLPPELRQSVGKPAQTGDDWIKALRRWADGVLAHGGRDILDQAVPAFERTLIEVALQHTNGRKRDAAALLGWGRNTLTRKIKELKLEARYGADD